MIRPIQLATLLILALLLLTPAPAKAQDQCPAVPAGPGVQRLEGQGSYSFYGLPTIIVDQPAMALVDDGLAAQGDRESYPNPAGQVLGLITSDFFTSPFSYTINLPFAGSGIQVDLSHSGKQDAGVQVYKVVLAQNMLNTVPLSGIAQSGILNSYYRDNVTNEIVQGALVVYAPDDKQSFPCGYGPDGKLFTADDPLVTLPQGFTVANIADGKITFDRSQVARVDVGESPGGETPDFSNQGIAQSFETLVDFLKKRYVFNEFFPIDWDALHATYLPRVQQADADKDLGAYFIVLLDLAHDLADAHVYVQPGNIMADPAAAKTARAGVPNLGGGVRAGLVELDDGRVIVTSAAPGGPAADAGFTFGTQILSVDGVPVKDVLEKPVRTLESPGTPESRRIERVNYLLKRPIGGTVEVAYQQPGATEVMTTVLTAVSDLPPRLEAPLMPLEYKLVDGVGYVTWPAFDRTGIATHIFADFIKVMNQRQIPGIILDLRSNGGGSAFMEYAIASYLFGADKPLNFKAADSYDYNPRTGAFDRSPQTTQLSSPPGARPYLGDVVILVDQHCASACEFLSYWLQANGRATIVGQHATEGAGGNTNAVFLPGGIQFNYTAGTILDTKTNRPAFQAVGVKPDIRVPVTEETERAKQAGGDPVLDAGIQHLRRLAFQRLDLQPAPFASATITSVVPTTWKLDRTGTAYTSPDLPVGLAIERWSGPAITGTPITGTPITGTGSVSTTADAIALSLSPDVKKASDFATDAGTWSVYAAKSGPEASPVYTLYGILIRDDQPYVVTATTTDQNLVPLITEYIFVPALRGFTPAP